MVVAAFVGRLIQWIGAAAVLAVAGVCAAVGRTSLAVLGPAIVVLALLLFVANMALTRLAPIRARSAPRL